MLATVLILLWVLAIMSGITFGGFVHVLLGAALALIVSRIVWHPRPATH